MSEDPDTVAAEFEDLSRWCEGSSPLYERVCAIAAADDALLDVAAAHTPGQPAPQLFLAAVQAELFASDATDDPGTVDGALAADAPLVVSHSLVLYQFDDDARESFHDALAALAAERDAPTFHLAGERPDPDVDHGIQLRLARVQSAVETEHFGTFEQHGAWVAWKDDDADASTTNGPSTIHQDA